MAPVTMAALLYNAAGATTSKWRVAAPQGQPHRTYRSREDERVRQEETGGPPCWPLGAEDGRGAHKGGRGGAKMFGGAPHLQFLAVLHFTSTLLLYLKTRWGPCRGRPPKLSPKQETHKSSSMESGVVTGSTHKLII